jgi:hypothetical protein
LPFTGLKGPSGVAVDSAGAKPDTWDGDPPHRVIHGPTLDVPGCEDVVRVGMAQSGQHPAPGRVARRQSPPVAGAIPITASRCPLDSRHMARGSGWFAVTCTRLVPPRRGAATERSLQPRRCCDARIPGRARTRWAMVDGSRPRTRRTHPSVPTPRSRADGPRMDSRIYPHTHRRYRRACRQAHHGRFRSERRCRDPSRTSALPADDRQQRSALDIDADPDFSGGLRAAHRPRHPVHRPRRLPPRPPVAGRTDFSARRERSVNRHQPPPGISWRAGQDRQPPPPVGASAEQADRRPAHPLTDRPQTRTPRDQPKTTAPTRCSVEA